MGLDAMVHCNCLKEGKTTNPPVDPGRIYFNEGYPACRVLEGTSMKEELALWDQIQEWAKTCCPHRGMEYCDEHVGNWAAVRHLQQAVREAGQFPCLLSIFPQGNGGEIAPELAGQVLAELEAFCAFLGDQQGWYLIDAVTGRELYSYIASYEGVFSYSGTLGVNTGFDPGGFFVRDRHTGEELFRSMHFTQQALPSETIAGRDGKGTRYDAFLLTDVAAGRQYRSARVMDGNIVEFKVISRPEREEDFYAIAPLRRLLQASLETGNPVCWG